MKIGRKCLFGMEALLSRECYPGDLLEIVEEQHLQPICEEMYKRLLLSVTDLEREQSARFKCSVSLGDQPTVDFESGIAGKKGDGWFEIAYLGMKVGTVARGDIRWVAYDGIEASGQAFLRQASKEVGQNKMHTLFQMMIGSILPGHLERLGGEVDRRDSGLRQMGCKCQRNGSGSCADVEDMDRLVVRQPPKDSFNEMLCLRTGNQCGRGDIEGQAEELLLAGDVLDGFVTEPPRDGTLVERDLSRLEHAVRMRQQGSPIHPKDVQKQELRIAIGLVAKVEAGGELVGGESQCLT